MRVAVTGAGGRLGSALRDVLGVASFVTDLLAWDLPEHNLDDPASAERLVGRDLPDVVIHAGAWTDVDGCAPIRSWRCAATGRPLGRWPRPASATERRS